MDNRRKTLKKVLGVSVIISLAQWTKPIVNNVFLPAHAQTSTPEPPTPPAVLTVVDDSFSFNAGGSAFPVNESLDILSNDSTTGGEELSVLSITIVNVAASNIVFSDAGVSTTMPGVRVSADYSITEPDGTTTQQTVEFEILADGRMLFFAPFTLDGETFTFEYEVTDGTSTASAMITVAIVGF